MPRAAANGIALNYEQTGSGPDVVLVHGLATNLAFWFLRSVPLLRQDFRLTAYDLRGHGRSEMPSDGYGSASMAADLLGLLDSLGLERAHLVGHSFGGAIALECALRAPGRVRSLTLVDTRLTAFQPARRLREWPHFDKWRAHLERSGEPIPDPDEILDYLALAQVRNGAGPGRERALRPGSGRADRAPGGRMRLQWLRLLASTTAKVDFAEVGPDLEAIRHLAVPTLAIFGELSHCLPTLAGLEATVRCRSVRVRGAGHFFPVTRPRLFVVTLRRFLLRASGEVRLDEFPSSRDAEITVEPATPVRTGIE